MHQEPRASRGSLGVVLVAEDSPVIRLMVRATLEDAGYQVLEAQDGQRALELCRTHEPDLVLLDILMPEVDGYGVLAELKADPVLADTPVVFITGMTSQEDVARGLELGAHDYLRKPFDPSELAARTAAAMRVKQLHDELRARNAVLELMARTDALTGLANRRQIADQLRQAGVLASRQGASLAALMIDIDHFKAVNDTYGHSVGDEVLRRVAFAIQGTMRLSDIVGRWGGEEFLAVLPLTDEDGARELAGRVLDAVRSSGPADATALPPVTVSVGYAAGPGNDIEALIRAADAALYDAKAAGRNTLAPPQCQKAVQVRG